MSPFVTGMNQTVVVHRDKYGMPTKCEVDGVTLTNVRTVEAISEVREPSMVRLLVYGAVEYVDEVSDKTEGQSEAA